MQTVYTEAHHLHAPRKELSGGTLVAPFEDPSRVERVLERIRDAGLGKVSPPKEFGLTPIHRIHPPAFTSFLESVWAAWTEEGYEGEAIPVVGPVGRSAHIPRDVTGRLGYFAFAADTSITEGSWRAARAAVNVVLTARELVVGGEPGAFALCRPPGHHAAPDLYGGYCFLNNAAIAAQAFLDQGAQRVAVLDVDFHHGNGTQAAFYDRSEVLFLSLHGDPDHAFPYFWGHADEKGAGAGEGWTGNYPLPYGTTWDRWGEALAHACARIGNTAPDALVVSLGVDAFRGDPISFFGLESEDFRKCGARIGRLRLPTLFVMEGGYAVDAIGINTVNVLTGFEETSRG